MSIDRHTGMKSEERDTIIFRQYGVKRLTMIVITVFVFFTGAYSQINIYSFNFDNDTLTGWTNDAWGLNGAANKQCSWIIGYPNGGTGYNDIYRRFEGNPDPTIDNTPDNTINYVAGQGLSKSNKREGKSGHYNNSSEWFQSPALDFTNYYDVTLEYYRWANFETGYDFAFIEVSTDGTNWDVVYNPSALYDNGWVKHTLDISKYADRQSLIYIRWRSESDGSIFYSGWNIDDITISGKQSTNDNTSTITPGNIVVPTTISSTVDTYGERITIGEFTITDAASGDGLPTIVDTLIISKGANNTISDWASSIKDIFVYEAASGEERTGIVNSDNILFTKSLLFTIPDGGSRTYEFSFYLDAKIEGGNDNEQFEFTVDYGNTIVNPAGSFIGSGIMSTGASKLILDIQATQLSFLVEPEQLVSVNRDLLPQVKVAATDENGNVDVDYNGNITLSNSGGLSMVGTVETTVAGVATFSSCQFTEVGGPVILLNSHTGSSSISNTSSDVSITVQDNISDAIFYANFDDSGLSGWTSGSNYGGNSWEVGIPNGGQGYSDVLGQKGFIGNADPTVDYSATNSLNNVYGQGLSSSSKFEGNSGHYNSAEEWLMSPAIDLTDYYSTQLSFWRWANMEPFYDSAFVEISLDGSNWIIMDHPLFPSDQQWTNVVYDLSSIADRQATVYIRWRTVSDGSIFYSGWNIDDIEVTGIYSPVTDWLGTTSSDWNNAANWSAGIVPNQLSNVYINASTPYRPIVTSSAQCNEIIIKKDAILEVDYTGDLTVYGDVQIETDSKNYGSLIDRGSLTIYGKGKVSRYLLTDQWHYICSPIKNVNSTEFGDEIYYYDEVVASNNWYYGWVLAENIQLETARGYDVYKFQDDIVNLEGEFNTGNYGITVTNTDGIEVADHEGWNLIGNPYPSAIDWDASSGWTKTNINDAIYIWDNASQNYVTYISGVGANGGSRYIPPMQAYFVRVTNPGNGYIGMTNDVRIANTGTKLKSSGSNEEGITISISNTLYTDEAVVRFLDGAGMNFDQSLDAYKKFSTNKSVPQIFTTTDKGDQLVINSYPSKNDYTIVPVYISVANSGNYTVQFDGVWNIDYSQTVYLEDLVEDTIIDLQKTFSYSFYSEKLENSERFLLHIGMPLKSEFSVKHVSADGASDGEIDLTILGGKQPLTKVEWSNGATTEDLKNLSAGEYIVTITDAANNVLSDTITIEQANEESINNVTVLETIEESGSDLKVFANDNTLHIIPSDINEPIQSISVYSISGKMIYNTNETKYGESSIQLNVPNGFYLARVMFNNVLVTEKFILK